MNKEQGISNNEGVIGQLVRVNYSSLFRQVEMLNVQYSMLNTQWGEGLGCRLPFGWVQVVCLVLLSCCEGWDEYRTDEQGISNDEGVVNQSVWFYSNSLFGQVQNAQYSIFNVQYSMG